MIRYLLAAVLGLGLIVVAFAAHADPLICVQAPAALKTWQEKYGEAPLILGHITNGPALVITVNPTTGTWTEWVSPDPGVLCATRAGDHWMVKLDGEAS